MGSIQKRVNAKGETFTATIRHKGIATISKTFKRRSDAVSWMHQEETKVQQGLYLDGSINKGRTFVEAVDKFVKEVEIKHSFRKAQLGAWCKVFGPRFLMSIGKVDIDEITSRWRKQGPVKIPLSPGSANRYLSSLSVLFEEAIGWGWVKRNPVREAKKYKEPPGRVRFLTEEEQKRLLEACRKSSYQPLETVVILALGTGMRRSELLSLRWDQVNLNEGVILLKNTKNGDSRRVYVRGAALEKLREFSKVRRIDSTLLFCGEKPSPTNAQRPCEPQARRYDIRKPFNRAVKEAKLENFVFHSLRHSCASFLAMNGATLLEIAEVLGHRSLDVTRRYSHLSNSHVAGVVERMTARFIGGSNSA